MELISILSSGAAARMVHVANPHVFFPDVASFIQKKYRFVEYPHTAEQLLSDNFVFKVGYYNGTTISELVLHNEALFAGGDASTSVFDALIDEIIAIGREEFGMTLEPVDLPRLYNSRLEVRIKPGFERWLATINPIAAELDAAAASAGIRSFGYGLTTIALGAEGDGALKPARFIFERRANRAHAENVFFTEAPLGTLAHMELIERLEALF